jgi:hypothetical protein
MFEAPSLDVVTLYIGGSIPVCVSHCHEGWTAGITNLMNHPYGIWKQILILLEAMDILLEANCMLFLTSKLYAFLEAMLMETNVTLEADNVSFVSNL